MNGPGPYREWPPPGDNRRWLCAADLFGRHLLESAAAWDQVPASTSAEAKAFAKQVGIDVLHGVMALLDGVPRLETEDGCQVEYVLLARIRPPGESTAAETIELAPGGDGLRLGLAGWIRGDFGGGRAAAGPGAPGQAPASSHQQRRRESIQRRTADGPPCPYCGKPLRTEKAKQCFHCGRNWRENPSK